MSSASRLPLVWATCALLLSTGASAVQVNGVALADRVQIGSGGPKLVLNGAGVRTRLVFQIYVAALYLPAKKNSGEEILHDDQPRRLLLQMLRDVTPEELTASMTEALNETLTPAERAPLESRVQQFNALLETLHDVRQGTRIAIDYVPRSGTIVSVDGNEKGRIPGADFNQALLRMWIGAHPRDFELRTALLGGRPGSN
jgi:hypothetical protein